MNIEWRVLLTVMLFGVIVVGCSDEPVESVQSSAAEPIEDQDADIVTTLEMRQALTRDYEQSLHNLRLLNDQIDSAFSDTVVTRLRSVRQQWSEFRSEQCEALKFMFEDGTYGPVAELYCLLDITRAHRAFLRSQLDFALPRPAETIETSQ
ncbi:MAG: DUF1311 domain-containing protein [Gemmatimonas sp.]|nr:DUF1311 domain-containing protein [Gemmatimonas sp.]